MATVDEQIKELRDTAWARELTDPEVASVLREAADTLARVKEAIVWGARMDAHPTHSGQAWQDWQWYSMYVTEMDTQWRENMKKALNDPS